MRRLIAIVTLALPVGCSSTQRVPVSFINEYKPEVVHLANSYGIVTTVQSPRLSGDTVYGTKLGEDREVAVPLRQVEGVSARRFDKARTAVVVLGGVGIVGLSAWAMFGGSSGDVEVNCDYTTRALEQTGAPVCTQR